MDKKRGSGFWVLISTSIVLSVFLLIGQTFSLFYYDAAIKLGLQESVGEITAVGIAFAKGFAFGDTVFYIPLLIAGIIGLIKRKKWGLYSMLGSLAISVYWPLVHLFAIHTEKVAITLNPEKYISFSIILPIIILYGLWGMWYLYKNRNILLK